MNRIAPLAVATLLATSLAAQTAQPTTPPARRPGAILERPDAGRITAPPAPEAEKPVTPAPETGEIIERFETVGNTSVASDTIRVYLGVNPGEKFNPGLIQRNFLNLWQTGLFDDIKVETVKGDSGVIVRATVKERPRIGSVEFRGNKDLTSAKINEALEKEKIDLHVGSTMEQTLIRRAAEAIKIAYAENGYEGVSVDTMTEDMQENEKRIVFIVNEGIKAKVSGIDFTGNTVFSDGKLRSRMKEVKKDNIVNWIRKKNLYIPSKLDEDLENIRNHYQDHGYMSVSFGEPVIEQVKTGKKPRVKIVIPVKEGVVKRLGDVTVTGNTLFTSDQIIGSWPVKKGDIVARKPMQARIDAFADAYRARGYIYSYVNPEYVEKEGDIVDLNIQVFEGDQFRLGRLEFQGNTTTKDKVLRREIFIEEGDIMDMETFKQSIYKLGQLGYFKVTENPDFQVNQEKKQVDVLIKGNEEGKNDIQFGGGYSEGTGFFIQTQFSTRNFLGEGENFGVSFQRGNHQNFFSLSYSDPWFLDTPNSLGVSIFNRNTTFPASAGYDERSTGGTFSYGYRLRRFDSVSFVYGLERVRSHYESNVPPDQNGNVPIAAANDFNFTQSSIGPAYMYDSRDNSFDTTRGRRTTIGLSFAGGPLGGTIHVFRPTFDFTYFKRLTRKTHASVNTSLGYIMPLSDDCANSLEEAPDFDNQLCVPKGQRFLVGGEYTVRGFEFGTLGPTETFAGVEQIAGGYKQVVANTEFVFRVNDPIRLVFFADAGWAYAHDEKVELSKLRYSTGAELRVFLPVFQFPIRFIYAINPWPQRGDRFQGFQFTIGNTY